jgi:hypothetical protein
MLYCSYNILLYIYIYIFFFVQNINNFNVIMMIEQFKFLRMLEIFIFPGFFFPLGLKIKLLFL